MGHNWSMKSRMRSHSHRAIVPFLVLLLAGGAAPAFAQVQVQSLAAPDLFSTPAAQTDLGPDLWKDTAPDIARDVLPRLAARPLSPAFADLALRVLATGATGPAGLGNDPDLAAARAMALIALGEARGADAVLDRAPGLAGSAALSLAAAEAALIKGDDDKACRIGDTLTVDRGAGYWLRLRAFCQARAGQADAAQLTFSLAQQQTRDADYARLMGALLAGSGEAGPANLRNGVNYALSRRLGLDIQAAAGTASSALKPVLRAPSDLSAGLAGADLTAIETSDLAFLRQAKGLAAFIEAARTASTSIRVLAQADAPLRDPVLFARAALAAGDLTTAQAIRARLTQDQIPGATITDLALLDALLAAAAGKADNQVLDRLVELGAQNGVKSPAQPAALLLATLGGTMSAQARGQFASFDVGKPAGSTARLMLLDEAATAGIKGEAALLALAVAADAGVAGPGPADRARIAKAFGRVGLAGDAWAVVVEGLLALQLAR
ncbi:hypothetical protein AQ619_13280 [Caulobacter henricii]|uniref:Uncharacterized protein n=2 Tax=Caulobacter henricii TaxID=69395 RepID=A0A0P0P428_9CAUL|nr:hypothetical protein AQ619_13280 [Caulobacter henricii]